MENKYLVSGSTDEESAEYASSVSLAPSFSNSDMKITEDDNQSLTEISREEMISTETTSTELQFPIKTLLKKNSKSKVSKRLLMEKLHVNNISKKPYKVVIPRIIKSDIRRQYPTMLLNLLNMSEYELISTFFLTFCHRNTVLESVVLPRPKTNPRYQENEPGITQTFHLNSFIEMSKFLWILTLAVPDHIVKLRAATISTKSDSFRTEIALDVSVLGTKIYDANPIEIAGMVRQLELEGRDCNSIGPKEIASRMIQTGKYCPPRPLRVDGRYILTIHDYRESLKIDKIYQQSIALMD